MSVLKRLSILYVFIFVSVSLFQSETLAASYSFEDYLSRITKIVRTRTEQPKSVYKKQSDLLIEYSGKIRELGGRSGDGDLYRQRRTKFDQGGVKESLIRKWQSEIGLSWPTYFCSSCCRGKKKCEGHLFEAHHVIPLGYNGLNKWWNIFPLTIEDHTGKNGIHSSPEAKAWFPKVKK